MIRIVVIWIMSFVGFSAYGVSSDFKYDVREIFELSVTNPPKAHSTINTMREQQVLPAWKLNLIEGDCYINQRQFRQAKTLLEEALHDEAMEDSIEQRMHALKRLMGVCDRLYDDEELTTSLYELEQLAEGANNPYYLAQAQFMFGKRKYQHNLPQGIPQCLKAVDMMKKTNHPYIYNTLFFFYADLLQMYRDNHQLDEALKMSFLHEEAASKMRSYKDYGLYFPTMRIVYALRSTLYAEMGLQQKADQAYRKWKSFPVGHPADDKVILPYLITSGHLDEAEQLLKDYEHYLVDEGDSISIWMLSTKGHQAIVLDLQERDQEALSIYNELNNMVVDLYKTRSQQLMNTTYSLLRQQEKTHLRAMWLNIGVVIIFALLVALIFFVMYIRQIRERNRRLYNLVNGLDAYRYMVMLNESDDAKIASDGQSSTISSETGRKSDPSLTEEGQSAVTSSSTDDAQKSEGKPIPDTDVYQKLFVEMDKKVTRDKLFLNPNLSREDLMALVGLDKNRFGKMMSRYSSASNVSTYVSAKRAEYAAQLMKLHPDYTIAAISEMCGMSNTVTFNRTFKNLYGVTPSEYRARIEREIND